MQKLLTNNYEKWSGDFANSLLKASRLQHGSLNLISLNLYEMFNLLFHFILFWLKLKFRSN